MSDYESTNGSETSVTADNTEVVTPATEPTIGQKVQGYLLQARDIFRKHAYEVYLVSIVVALAAFVLLYPKTALGVGATALVVSGWVAYFGLRKRVKEGKAWL